MNTIFLISIVTLLFIAGIAYIAIPPGALPGNKDHNITSLVPVEVREYEGDPLSSIADFRDNAIHGPQYVNQSDYHLEVYGLVNNPLSRSYSDLINSYSHYEKKVALFCVEGWEVTILWEGVKVEDLLADAGIAPSATTVIFYAADGYSTSLPLDYITERDIILAYAMNGVVLPPERGFPFQLIAEDRWGYKWIKWVTAIEVSDNPSFQGYWEKRGYSQTADTHEGFYR